jgi:hypothetical protein
VEVSVRSTVVLVVVVAPPLSAHTLVEPSFREVEAVAQGSSGSQPRRSPTVEPSAHEAATERMRLPVQAVVTLAAAAVVVVAS